MRGMIYVTLAFLPIVSRVVCAPVRSVGTIENVNEAATLRKTLMEAVISPATPSQGVFGTGMVTVGSSHHRSRAVTPNHVPTSADLGVKATL